MALPQTQSSTVHAIQTREPPLADSRIFGGALIAFRRDPLGTLMRAAQRHGDIVQFRLGPVRAYALTSPQAAQHVLVDQHRNYSKRTRGYDALRLVLGNGLVTSEGDFWRRQRRIAQPAFHRQRIASFAETMVGETIDLLARWRDRPDAPMDIAHEMTDLTLRIVSRTLLSVRVGDQDARIGDAVECLNRYARDMMTNPLVLPTWVPTAKNRRFRRHARTLDEIVGGIIDRRRAHGDDSGDLLAMLMSAEDAQTGERMTDAQLRDEVMTIFLAGHETTANALAWTLLLLSQHPDVCRRLQAELDAVLDGRPPTLPDLPQLAYTRCVIDEAMRLYPPAWTIGRRCESDDIVDGFRIRGGSLVILSPWVTHRDPKLWPNPEGFDPDRFGPDAPKRPRYAYFPFGGGPRQCIGTSFARMEAELVLATLMQSVEVALQPGHRPVPDAFITLQPRGGLPMRPTFRRPPP